NPYYAEAHYNLGGYYYSLGQLEKAEAEFKMALAIKPEFEMSRYYLREIYKEKNS
ncbi:MAG: tetratricopeptide repeat protein, partial [Nitrospinales bacterium]